MSENYRITLKPVYSQTVPTPDGVKLPKDWLLSWHQAATLEALRDPNIDVVFNTAMTGDGKSLAAYLEVLQGEFSAIGLYPTNELARDQETQIRGYVEKFQPENQPRVVRLSGADLEIYAENEGLKKGAAIATLTNQREALLTNPDIFHYLHRGAYIIRGDSPDKLWGRIDKDFDLFIFDEFHVFAAPQIASVINTMLLIRCTNRRKKFLFLSATPDTNLIGRLEKAGFRCKEIDPLKQNKYQFPDTPEEGQQLQTQGWRQVARTITLNFIPLEPSFKASETWIQNNSENILSYFQQYPGSKGAIILNSIAAVKRLTKKLKPLFKVHDLIVEENTGLSGKTQKEESLKADLVLGTSTIDVGIDFKINFLIFESSDAGSFIQRLGRLGRHENYEKDSQLIKFENFTAFAIVHEFLVGRLFKEGSPPLENNSVYDRPKFNQIIYGHYREIEIFNGYYRRWGAVQSVRLCLELKHKTIQQQYMGSLETFSQACEQVFDTKLKCHAGRIKQWRKEWLEIGGKQGNPIADDAASFRGLSPLQCGIYDLSEDNEDQKEADKFKTYDLPGILSNLEIEMWTKEAFMRTLKEIAERTGQPIAKGRFAHCLAFIKLRSYREEPLNWKFTFSRDLEQVANSWKVQLLTGIGVWQPDNLWALKIDKLLRKQALVCYVIPVRVAEVRGQLKLPMHFQIYPITDRVHDTTAPYSIVFGQSALLIDIVAPRLKSKGGIHIA